MNIVMRSFKILGNQVEPQAFVHNVNSKFEYIHCDLYYMMYVLSCIYIYVSVYCV